MGPQTPQDVKKVEMSTYFSFHGHGAANQSIHRCGCGGSARKTRQSLCKDSMKVRQSKEKFVAKDFIANLLLFGDRVADVESV